MAFWSGAERRGRTGLAGAMLAAALLAGLASPAASQPAPLTGPAIYELRTYHANPGKLEALQARFRNHTLRLFEKAGMTNVAYWTAEEAGDGKVIYVLAYPSREAREAAWARFRSDPEWRAAAAASEADGKLVAKVESVLMRMTDYSPHPTTAAGVPLR